MTSSPVSEDSQSSVTHSSRPEDDWTRSGLAVHTNVPMRARNWRSSSFGEKQRKHPRLGRETVDRDCGICFEIAVSPSRTLCCGKLFCYEHICDWLHGAGSDGRCPACGTHCSVDTGVLSLAPPPLRSPPNTPVGNMMHISPPKVVPTTTPVNELVEIKFARPTPLQIKVPSEHSSVTRRKLSTSSGSSSGSSSPETSTSSTVVGSAVSEECAKLGEFFKTRVRAYTDTDQLLLSETAKILRRKLQAEAWSPSSSCVASDEDDDSSKGREPRRQDSDGLESRHPDAHIYSPHALEAVVTDVIERDKTPTPSNGNVHLPRRRSFTSVQRRRPSLSSRRSSRSSSISRSSSTRTIQALAGSPTNTMQAMQPDTLIPLVGPVSFEAAERVLSIIGLIIVYYVLFT
ncbi:hypothetical protein VNI00_005890 [Paramarasmius palmivorus]|uniref:RING-type domain-containing protein n=1 Tax=Paramarasmius palmivorus TaxID=297713 RepID=A0AAW0DDV2_9AGAR